MKYTETDNRNVIWESDDLGSKYDFHDNDKGSTFEERIVEVYCIICAARFIGPIRQAGGFLGGHDLFHTWEFKIEMITELEA